MQQVILNLIMNAVEVMSEVAEGSRELLMSTNKADSKAVLVTVSDSGPGLPPANLARIFEAFYTTKAGGLGMGLSIWDHTKVCDGKTCAGLAKNQASIRIIGSGGVALTPLVQATDLIAAATVSDNAGLATSLYRVDRRWSKKWASSASSVFTSTGNNPGSI
jgi:Histidine kinase-, DNA gyrase B-, and HSP90-like ATPase